MKSLHLSPVVLSVTLVGFFVAACAGVEPLPEEPGPEVAPCVGPLVSFSETEPNDGTTQSDHNVVETEDGDLLITGSSSLCGNDGTTWTGDVDVFEVSYGCGGQANVALSWTNTGGTAADLDYTVLAPEASTTHYASVGYDWLESSDGSASLEEDLGVSMAGPLRVSIMCWLGDPDQNWEFRVTWDNTGVIGDDDDSAGDDDDSAGDDDDAVGDDDDSAGDDDDSAGQ